MPADALTAEAHDHLPLGTGPRPTTGRELERLVLDLLRTGPGDTELRVEGLARVTVTASMQGADVTAVTLDATGVALQFPMDVPESEVPAGPDQLPEPLRREPATLRKGTARALPLTIQGVPIDLEADIANAPIEWLTLPDDKLGVAPRGGDGSGFRKPSRVSLRIGLRQADILPAIVAPIRLAMKDSGVRLSRENLTLRQLGPRRVRFGLRARIQWKLLAATFRARAEVDIDSAFILRVGDVRVSSTNPFVGLILLALRGRIRRELQESLQPFPLNEALAPWELRQLRINIGDRIELSADLGP